MTVIVNPGSRLPSEPHGWTNTREGAQREAHDWLERMRAEGLGDIQMREVGACPDGRWSFVFRHTVTGAEVVLETHGIDNMDAYLKQAIFPPRTYWNGSSSACPQLSDFAAPGYVMTFREGK